MNSETAKQRAREIVEKWQDTYAFKIPKDIKEEKVIDLSFSLLEAYAEALASKVVVYNEITLINELDKIIKGEMELNGDEPSDDLRAGFIAGFYFCKDSLKLAPKEPEVKAQGFEELKKTIVYRAYCISLHKTDYTLGIFFDKKDAEKILSNQQITASGPQYGIDELLVYGQANSKRVVLPEYRIFKDKRTTDNDYEAGYVCGFNDAIDSVKSMNEGEG